MIKICEVCELEREMPDERDTCYPCALAAATARAEEAEDKLALTYCAFCGHETPMDTADAAALRAHVMECPKHPLHAEIERLMKERHEAAKELLVAMGNVEIWKKEDAAKDARITAQEGLLRDIRDHLLMIAENADDDDLEARMYHETEKVDALLYPQPEPRCTLSTEEIVERACELVKPYYEQTSQDLMKKVPAAIRHAARAAYAAGLEAAWKVLPSYGPPLGASEGSYADGYAKGVNDARAAIRALKEPE